MNTRMCSRGGVAVLLSTFLLLCSSKLTAADSTGELWTFQEDPDDLTLPGKGSENIAINFYGLARSLKFTLPSIKKNLISPIEAAGYNVDIFLHTYDLEHTERSSFGEDAVLNTTEWRVLSPLASEVTSQDEFIRRYTLEIEGCKDVGRPTDPNWSEEQDPTFKNHINLFCQLGSISRVSRLWQREHTLKQYKAVIYARPDVHYSCPFPVEQIQNIQADTVYVPNFHSSGGVNDRLQLSTPEVAALVGDRFFLTIGTCGNKPVHSEEYMLAFAETHNLTTVALSNFPFYRIRADGRVSVKDLTGLPPPCDPEDLNELLGGQQLVPEILQEA